MFGKPEEDDDDEQEFYLYKGTRNTVSRRGMKQEKLARHCEVLTRQA